jgi:LemA protein
MKNTRLSAWIIGGILILLLIYFISTYNKLVGKEEKLKLQWNEVQNAYQRRLDLIPNLVNVVKGGADYEQTTLQKLTEARAKAGSLQITGLPTAETYNQQTNAQNEIAGAANRLMIAVENYPDLKGTKAFSDLQTQLVGTERRIKVARKDFNLAIADYNSYVKGFPTKIVAGVLGFHPKDGFQSDAGADKAVEISFQ